MSGPRGRVRKRKKQVVEGSPRGKLLTVKNARGDTKTVYARDFHGSKWKDYTIIS